MFIIIIPDNNPLGRGSMFEPGDIYTWEQIEDLYNNIPQNKQCMVTVYDTDEKEFCSIDFGEKAVLKRDAADLTDVDARIVLKVLHTPEHELMRLIANKELITQFPLFYKIVKARVECKF